MGGGPFKRGRGAPSGPASPGPACDLRAGQGAWQSARGRVPAGWACPGRAGRGRRAAPGRVSGRRVAGGGAGGGGSSMDWGTELWVSPIGASPSSVCSGSDSPSPFVPSGPQRGLRGGLRAFPRTEPRVPGRHRRNEFFGGVSEPPRRGAKTHLAGRPGETEARGRERDGPESPGQAGAAGRGHLFWASRRGPRLILRPLGPCPPPACPAGRPVSHVGPARAAHLPGAPRRLGAPSEGEGAASRGPSDLPTLPAPGPGSPRVAPGPGRT